MFSRESPVVLVLYHPGAGGDLLSSIIRYHYKKTLTGVDDINERGKASFLGSDSRLLDIAVEKCNFNITTESLQELVFTDQLIADIDQIIAERGESFIGVDTLLIDSHLFNDESVIEVQKFFTNSKIIRITITTEDREIINLLSDIKILDDEDVPELIKKSILRTADAYGTEIQPSVKNTNIFDFRFSAFFNKEEFEEEYSKLVNFLELPYKIVNYDFIQYWISKHPQEMRDIFNERYETLT